jgi:hypothetical protein
MMCLFVSAGVVGSITNYHGFIIDISVKSNVSGTSCRCCFVDGCICIHLCLFFYVCA